MINKAIETINRIEKDELTTDEKKYYIIQMLDELMSEVSEFDKSMIETFKKFLINDANNIQLGITCFYIKIYLNEIKGWY